MHWLFFVYSLANALLSRFYLNYYSKSWPSLEISIILLKSCFPRIKSCFSWCMQCQIWCNAIRVFAPDGKCLSCGWLNLPHSTIVKKRQKLSFLLGCFEILPPFSSHHIWKIVNLLFFLCGGEIRINTKRHRLQIWHRTYAFILTKYHAATES